MWLLFGLNVIITSLGFVYSFGCKTIKYPVLHWLVHTHLYSKYIQNLTRCYHFRCYYCGLWKKPTDFSSSSWIIAITSSLLAAVSTFAFLLNLHASRSFQNAGQFMSHPLLTQVQHPRPFLTHSCLPLLPRAPCAVPLRKRMEVLEEDFHELQALIGIPALVPGCLLYSSRSWTVSVAT